MRRRVRWLSACGVGLTVGCAGPQVVLPAGHLPPPANLIDIQAAPALSKAVVAPPAPDKKGVFDLPPELPGAAAKPVLPPKFDRAAPAAERLKAVTERYPTLTPVAATAPADGAPLTLADLQQLAEASSPVLRRAQADVEAAYGQVVQAGLHPNPTVGYQVDQVQPGLRLPPGEGNGAGQHGGFVNQLIVTAGKLTLAQRVAGYDYINALVAVRKARVTVTAAVRQQYFAVLVARQTSEVNAALHGLAKQVYELQLKQVAAGETAGYEPLQLYAQAVQAENAATQAEVAYRAAWKQLAAAVGQPNLPVAELVGRADGPAPLIDPEAAQARVLEQHTDLLTARNTVAQAQSNLTLQQRLPIPDLQTNTYQQYDNATQAYQFGIQLGIQLPISDRNQGNVRTAQARIAAAGQALAVTQNELLGRLAEAFGRYEANAKVAANFRDKILPSLTQAYQGVVRRYQVEPEKVGFNDIVVAQQNLAQALQSYLTAVGGQWQAVVDLAAVAQLDELFPDGGK